jgi:anti-sigma regulatory factor (Ser/Thr protein kinase)
MVDAVLKTSKMEKVMPVLYELEEAIRAVGGDPSIKSDLGPAQVDSAVEEKKSTPAPSFAPDNVIKLSIKNEMSELEDLYGTVNQFLESHNTPHRSGYATHLALEELVVNVIRYAFIDEDEHIIDIGLGVFGEQIVLEIKDSGQPFDPREAPPHDPHVEDLQVGGLGLTLVLDMVNELTYRREGDKNHVRVIVQIRDEEENELSSAVNDGASAESDEF